MVVLESSVSNTCKLWFIYCLKHMHCASVVINGILFLAICFFCVCACTCMCVGLLFMRWSVLFCGLMNNGYYFVHKELTAVLLFSPKNFFKCCLIFWLEVNKLIKMYINSALLVSLMHESLFSLGRQSYFVVCVFRWLVSAYWRSSLLFLK